MTIAFPDGVAERIEALARQSGFASAAEFLMSLVEEGVVAGPPELGPRDRAELDTMIDAGMRSGPPVRATPEFWVERRRVFEERTAKRKGATS